MKLDAEVTIFVHPFPVIASIWSRRCFIAACRFWVLFSSAMQIASPFEVNCVFLMSPIRPLNCAFVEAWGLSPDADID